MGQEFSVQIRVELALGGFGLLLDSVFLGRYEAVIKRAFGKQVQQRNFESN
jgi:hypothetical protein